MKFAILIVIFVSVVCAEMSEDDIKKEINEILNDESDTSAEDEICEGIDNVRERFDDEEDGQCNEFYSYKTKTSCLDKGTLVESGYHTRRVNSQENKRCKKEPVFTTCHNLNTAQNYYTKYTIKQTIRIREKVRAQSWRIPKFFAAQNINKLFTDHRDIIGDFLGTRKWLEERLQGISLTKGHLAAAADFDDPNEKEVSCSFLNLAPQFQIFNNGHWKSVEYAIRKLATKSQTGLTVYAGTHETGELNDSNDVPKEIYLEPRRDGKEPKVPMPKLFYKMAIDENLNKGIVIIGVNNPHFDINKMTEEELKKYIICNDIADKLKWLEIQDRKNTIKGYVYACYVEDFIKKVKIPISPIPESKPESILGNDL